MTDEVGEADADGRLYRRVAVVSLFVSWRFPGGHAGERLDGPVWCPWKIVAGGGDPDRSIFADTPGAKNPVRDSNLTPPLLLWSLDWCFSGEIAVGVAPFTRSRGRAGGRVGSQSDPTDGPSRTPQKTRVPLSAPSGRSGVVCMDWSPTKRTDWRLAVSTSFQNTPPPLFVLPLFISIRPLVVLGVTDELAPPRQMSPRLSLQRPFGAASFLGRRTRKTMNAARSFDS